MDNDLQTTLRLASIKVADCSVSGLELHTCYPKRKLLKVEMSAGPLSPPNDHVMAPMSNLSDRTNPLVSL